MNQAYEFLMGKYRKMWFGGHKKISSRAPWSRIKA